jgi:hypothetical protein
MTNLLETIEQSNGKILTVVFVKKDGTERVLNGRLGVTKHLHGGKKTTGEEYLTIFDVKNGGYRSVNKSTIKEVRFGGKIIK